MRLIFYWLLEQTLSGRARVHEVSCTYRGTPHGSRPGKCCTCIHFREWGFTLASVTSGDIAVCILQYNYGRLGQGVDALMLADPESELGMVSNILLSERRVGRVFIEWSLTRERSKTFRVEGR